MATNVLVSKGGRKIASKNIDWNVSVQRFMIFRQENDLSSLTNPQVFALLKEKNKRRNGLVFVFKWFKKKSGCER